VLILLPLSALGRSHQITATYSGSLQMLSEVTGDAQAKIQALSNALLEQLGTLQVHAPLRLLV
jgi:hypothetical protein